MFDNSRVWIRGAGELGSGIAHLLHRLGFSTYLSEIYPPLAIRRPVTFSDAIVDDLTKVEGVQARHYPKVILPLQHAWDHIPVFLDVPDQLIALEPAVLVDARMLKHYSEDFRSWADLVIGLGPGFDTRKNCNRVIETMRGHNLARVITSGAASKDTGVPGTIGGETSRRIVRAPRSGSVSWTVDFGHLVKADERIGQIDQTDDILAPLDGIVRGLISPHTPVTKGMKIGDVDPRGASVQYLHISEKARAIASGVLEAIILHLNAVSHD